MHFCDSSRSTVGVSLYEDLTRLHHGRSSAAVWDLCWLSVCGCRTGGERVEEEDV